MVPGSFGCGSVVLAAMAMLAPSRAARLAMARPMPRLAPLMKSVFPLSVDMRGAPSTNSTLDAQRTPIGANASSEQNRRFPPYSLVVLLVLTLLASLGPWGEDPNVVP